MQKIKHILGIATSSMSEKWKSFVLNWDNVYQKLYVLACLFKLVSFLCVEVLWLSQPIKIMSSAVSLPNHTFSGQA